MSKKIALYMGHSGSEVGSVGLLREDDVTKEAVTIAINWFKARGFTVITDNNSLSLVQRIVKANNYQVDGLIEFHANMGGGTGTETWFSKYSPQNAKIAQKMSDSVKKYLPSRGAKNTATNRFGALGILDDTKTQRAYLSELFFLDNANDVKQWKAHKKAIVESICQAYCEAYGWVTTKPETKPENKPQEKPKPQTGKPRTWNEKGTFTIHTKENKGVALRYGRKKQSELVDWLYNGAKVKYDKAYADVNGYLWIRQTPRRLKNGKYVEAWIATGETDSKAQRKNYWGSFS